MPFLYGGHVVKAHVGRWSEDCPEHQGVVVLSMDDTPLVSSRIPMETYIVDWLQGFGVSARATSESKKLDPTAIVVFRQGDVGEYLREVSYPTHAEGSVHILTAMKEDSLFTT